jgi:hypothetical protein
VRYRALALLVVFLAGCAQSSAASSSLDRFDALSKSLHMTTQLASAVAADVRAINGGMAHNNRRWIRRSTVKLRQDSSRLARDSVALQGKLTRILKVQSKGAQRQYIGMTLGALRHQQWEARWAWKLADTVHRDPLLISPADYDAARFDTRLASRAAAASVTLVDRARALETHHPSQFGLSGGAGAGK